MTELYGNEAYSRAVRNAEIVHGIYDTASDGRDGTEGTVWDQDSRPVLIGGEVIPAMETHPMTLEEQEARFWRIKPSDILGLLLFLSFWPLMFIDPMLGLGYITGVGCALLLALYVTIEKWHDGKGE